jgi:hypothetical protein
MSGNPLGLTCPKVPINGVEHTMGNGSFALRAQIEVRTSLHNAVYLPYCVTILLSLIRLQYFFPFRASRSSGIVKNDPCICMPMYDFHMIAYVLRYIYSRLEWQHLRSVLYVLY